MEKKNKKIKNTILALFIIILLGISIYNIWLMYKNIEISNEYEGVRTSLSTNYAKNVDNSTDNSTQAVNMLETVTKSVVGISKLSSTGGSILNNIKSDELGLGTGIIVSQDGYILSNSHVTGEKYSNCYVTVDENTYEGSVKWSDTNLDLSIVKIGANNLPYVSLGDSSNIKVGENVYAVGNPIGYEFRKTVTSGIISALNRTIKIDENDSTSYISDLIQTDATINPGNSGGPLININGEVLGINSVKITSAEGIGFAIPINIIKPIIEKLTSTGECITPSLGIFAYDKNIVPYINQELDQNIKLDKGIYIAEVTKNSPAEKVGVKRGDILLEIDGIELEKMSELRTYIYGKNVGEKVNIKLVRSNKEYQISVTLAKK